MNKRMNKSTQNSLFKKIKFMLDSLFISETLIRELSWRKIYKLLKKATKYDSRYNFSKEELKEFSKNLKSINYKEKKINNIEIAQVIKFEVQEIIANVFHFIFNVIENFKINKFIDQYPLSIE